MTNLVDRRTGLPAVIKQPSEDRVYTFDFSALLGDSVISSVTTIFSTNQNLITGSSEVTLASIVKSDTKAQVSISDGTDSEHYKITARVLDSAGNTLEGDGMLFVEEL